MKRFNFILSFLFFSLGSWSQTIHLCEGDSLQEYWVDPSDINNDLNWSFITGNGAQFISGQDSDRTSINFPVPGTYVLQFEEINQHTCVGSVTLEIIVHPLPEPYFSYGPTCVGQPIEFINNSLVFSDVQDFYWTISNTQDTSFNIEYTFYQEGEYPVSLYIMDEWGCENTYTDNIQINSLPSADFYYTPQEISIIDPEVQFINLSTQNSTSIWSFGDQDTSFLWDPSHFYKNPGWYDVSLLINDDNGCEDSIIRSLFVKNELLFYVPESFTPNGDNVNDQFGPIGFSLDRVDSYKFMIYSQWGDIVFQTTDYQLLWDGKLSSLQDAPQDTYIWSIRITDEIGKETHHQGSVTLSK